MRQQYLVIYADPSGGWGPQVSRWGSPPPLQEKHWPFSQLRYQVWRGGEAPPLRGRNRAINDFPTGCKHSVDTAPHLSPNAHFPPSEQKKCNDDMKCKCWCCTITFDHFLPALVKCQCASTGFLDPDLHLPPATATPVPHTDNCCSRSAFSVITSPLIY